MAPSNWTPLNPQLYQILANKFGTVKVEKHGQPLERTTKWLGGRQTLDISAGGETYKVCCPWCGDNKFHLYISHAYGMLDPETGSTVRLATCYRHGSVMQQLKDVLEWCSMGPRQPLTVVAPQVVEEEPFQLPGDCIRLDVVEPRTDMARAYLAGRGIDPTWVAQTYGWCTCWRGNPDLWRGGCTNRIIVPVTYNNVAVGWQARLAFDPPRELKDKNFANLRWLSMPGVGWRSRNLIGYDQARACTLKFCILVEGPTDMAKHGPPFVGSLGQTMSPRQLDLVASTWGAGDGIVVLGDSKSAKGQEDLRVSRTTTELAKRCTCPIYAPRLPEGDPGSWEHNALLGFIKEFIKEHPGGVCHGESLSTKLAGG